MRASRWEEEKNCNQHISGAERIVTREKVDMVVSRLVERALHHSKGAPDFINIKVEEVKEDVILYFPALPVSTRTTKTPEEGRELVVEILTGLGIAHSREIVGLMEQAFDLRGALLLNVNTLDRLDPDPQHGLRATNMDTAQQNRDNGESLLIKLRLPQGAVNTAS